MTTKQTTTTTRKRPAVTLSQLSLRKAERGLVVGGSGSGKSTLAEQLLNIWIAAYLNARVLILDSKPRFRAEWDRTGRSAAHRYKRWDHGPYIAGSMLVEEPGDLAMAWKLGHRVVIAQGDSAADIGWMLRVADEFLRKSRASIPQLLYVDETLDYFSPNGQPRGGSDVLLRVARAGRERGTAGLYAAQRTKGIPVQLISELRKLYLFRLDHRDDEKRLIDCGAPRWIVPPTEDHRFYFWTKEERDKVFGPFQLTLPD